MPFRAHACVFLCVSLVPHQALINCAHQVTFEEVLMGVSASEAKFPSPFSPFLPPLFSSPIYLISFYESCSSLHVISRMRSDRAQQRGGGGGERQRPLRRAECTGWRSRCLINNRLSCGFKVFPSKWLTFLPPLPSCIGCLPPPAPRMKEVIPQLAFKLRMLPKVTAFFGNMGGRQ